MTEELPKYIVVGSKPWNKTIFESRISTYPGRWTYIDDPNKVTVKFLSKINPKYLFFLHWSLLVPDTITEKFECICFHMTDVPFGRGGSPLQNLILRGHTATRLTALKMVHDFDAGPVYIKRDLSLNGDAEEIYIRATELAAVMIKDIIEKNPTPVPQKGKAVIFQRRLPDKSRIPALKTPESLYDFIRMLDAYGYPKAFITYKGYRFEFSNASCKNGEIRSDVIITKSGERS